MISIHCGTGQRRLFEKEQLTSNGTKYIV